MYNENLSTPTECDITLQKHLANWGHMIHLGRPHSFKGAKMDIFNKIFKIVCKRFTDFDLLIRAAGWADVVN